MFEIKKDSIVDDYIVNSKHTIKCASKEFQIAEECKCWRVEFTKMILMNQKKLIDLELVKDKSVEKTLAEQYLEFIQTKWNPNYNSLHFKFEREHPVVGWKNSRTVMTAQKYLDHFTRYYPALGVIPGKILKVSFSKVGNEFCHDTGENPVITKWWDIKNRIRLDLSEEEYPLYIWDSFAAWCWADELPRKTFGIELKEEEVEFTVKIPDQIAHIPSVKCKDAIVVPGPSVLGKTFGVQNIPVVQMTTVVNNPKARKLKRIKTHSSYVKCTNKSRRVISTLTSEITCGHCFKLGKKKGLWV